MTIVNPSSSAGSGARLFVAGHSVASGEGGPSYPDNGAFIKVASLIGASRYDSIAKGGSILGCAEGDSIGGSTHYGGIGKLLQHLGSAVIAAAGTPYRTTYPYLPVVQSALIMWGLNDMAWMGPTTFASVFPLALTSAIARLRAGAVFEDSDASVAYTGASWATVTPTYPALYNSGTTVKSVSTNGQSLTVTVPSDFPGGTINLRFVTQANGNGALWTVAGTGCAAGVSTTYDTRNINGFDNGGTRGTNGRILNSVLRLTGLPAGSGTITATATTIQTSAYFDCWEIESPAPPPVGVAQQFRSFSYALYAAWPYPGIGDTDMTTINTAIQTAVGGFDANVFTIATDDVLAKAQVYFENNATGDNLHPNDLGHGLLANRLASAFTAQLSRLELAQTMPKERRGWKLLDGTGDVSFLNSWTDYNLATFAQSGYVKDFLAGRVTLRGHVAKTSGAANDVIFTLPGGYRPQTTIQLATPIFNGSAWGFGMLVVANNGNVSINAGGSIAAGAANVIDCTFLAEQ